MHAALNQLQQPMGKALPSNVGFNKSGKTAVPLQAASVQPASSGFKYHPNHTHPLIPKNVTATYYCDLCGTIGAPGRHNCSKGCNWDACGECLELLDEHLDGEPPGDGAEEEDEDEEITEEITGPDGYFRCDKNHKLTLCNGMGYYLSFQCNVCRDSTADGLGTERYFCASCQYDLCVNCAAK